MKALSRIIFGIFLFTLPAAMFCQTDPKPNKAVLKITLADENVIYGSITDRNNETITVRTIWMRDAVLYVSDIKEITVSALGIDELYNTVDISIEDTQNSVFRGRIIEASLDTIRFETSAGIQIAVPQQKIKRIYTASAPTESGRIEPADQVRTRRYYLKDKMFLNATGLMPYPGDTYLGTYYLFFPTITIGIHEYASILLGMSLIPGSDGQFFIVNPRIGLYQKEYSGVAISYLLASFTDDGDPFQSFMVNGTLGDENIQGTFGVGVGYVNQHFSDNPWFSLGATFRLSKSVKFITENHFYGDSNGAAGIVSFGFRFYGEDVAGDLAFWRPVVEDFDIDGWPFFPLVTLFYKF